MRLFHATGPYYIILLFHLQTTSRVCNIFASGLTVSLGAGIVMEPRFQTVGISLGTLARTCCRSLLIDVSQWPNSAISLKLSRHNVFR